MNQFAEAISLLHRRQYPASHRYLDKPPQDLVGANQHTYIQQATISTRKAQTKGFTYALRITTAFTTAFRL